MADWALDPTDGDLLITDGKTSIVRGDDALRQHLDIRLQFFKGEWFLDQRIGVPYYQQILVKSPNLSAVREIFRRAVLTTSGIASMERFDLALDNTTRTLSVDFTAKKTDGEPLDFSQEFILPVG